MDKCGGGGGGCGCGEDPYEEQLLAVFESCDPEGRGLLDGAGLSQLCQMLHLEERRDELVSKLIGPAKPSLVTDISFPKFREALLAILAAPPDTREASPVREVSPKFVYGQKKYGRRSRPESTDHDCQGLMIEEAEAETFIVEIEKTQNGKLSLDNDDNLDVPIKLDSDNTAEDYIDDNIVNGGRLILDKENESVAGEAELKNAWLRLGFGSDGYLQRNELAMICSTVGMDTLADQVVTQVFSKLNTDQDGKISFEEFLELFRSRVESPPLVTRSPTLPLQTTSPDSFTKSGMAPDLWENGGGSMNIPRLFQELQSVRLVLESVTEERDKLRSDLADANYRAAVLAQEVDDHHARIEKASQNKVKLLEQKHAEEMKEVKCQAAYDREQLVAANQKLEHEVAHHVDQLSKVGSQLGTLRKEFETLEKENRLLGERLKESEVSTLALHKQLECMNVIHQRVLELESAEECSSGLKNKLTALQSENTELRDRNDELTTQLELLQTAINTRHPQRREGSWEGSCGGGGGTKRRGAKSPPPGDWPGSGSRFIGKVRRCCTENDLTIAAASLSTLSTAPDSSNHLMKQQNSESGLESDFDTLAGTSPTPSNISIENGTSVDSEQEIERLRAYVTQLETKLDQYQMMKEWDLIKTNNANISDDDSSFQYLTTATVKSEVTQVTKTSISNASDIMSCTSLDIEGTSDKVETSKSNSIKRKEDDEGTINGSNLGSWLHKLLSKHESCSDINCYNFYQSIKDLLSKAFPGHNLSVNVEPSNSEECKNNSLGYSFPFKDMNLFDSMDEYEELLEDSMPKKMTKFDKLSQFAFEFVDIPQVVENVGSGKDKTSPEQTHKDVKYQSHVLNNSNGILIELERLREENLDLKHRCSDLEASLELMRVEYEKTEDYWTNKLDEERKLFELDQQQSDEKFAELELKIQEYAEMLSSEQGRKQNQLLPPIEERDYLEKQFTDLEEEYESYRLSVENELVQKDSDIANLEQALVVATRTLGSRLRDNKTAEVQTDCYQIECREEELIGRNFNSQSRSVSTFTQATEQHNAGADKRHGSGRRDCGCWCHEWERKETSRVRELRNQLRAECNTLFHQKQHLMYKLNSLRASSQQINSREVEIIEALSTKLREQESKCKYLQSALRQHHRHTQRLMNKAWERHKSDLMYIEGALKITQDKLKRQSAITKQQMEKLAAADVLVKDLFVKNSRLELALVQFQEHERSREENASNHRNNNNNYENQSPFQYLSNSLSISVITSKQFNSF